MLQAPSDVANSSSSVLIFLLYLLGEDSYLSKCFGFQSQSGFQQLEELLVPMLMS